VYGETYSFDTDTKWYNETEPIWITAERAGKSAGAYMWIGKFYKVLESTNQFPHALLLNRFQPTNQNPCTGPTC